MIMQTRFFILRDNTLFVYYNPEDKLPYIVIPLKGLFISYIKLEGRDGIYGFSIYHSKKNFKTRRFYHSNHELIQGWVKAIK